jgi:predicted DNA-binding transcriptional regulator AlpA
MDKSIPAKPRKTKRAKPKDRTGNAKLLQHRIVAEWLSVDPETLRRWVNEGEFPLPHSIIRKTWFYDAEMIRHYIKTGAFPESTRFRSGANARHIGSGE